MPVFVDDQGVPCAVAHMMRESGDEGKRLVEAINKDVVCRFALVEEMVEHKPQIANKLANWVRLRLAL